MVSENVDKKELLKRVKCAVVKGPKRHYSGPKKITAIETSDQSAAYSAESEYDACRNYLQPDGTTVAERDQYSPYPYSNFRHLHSHHLALSAASAVTDFACSVAGTGGSIDAC